MPLLIIALPAYPVSMYCTAQTSEEARHCVQAL